MDNANGAMPATPHGRSSKTPIVIGSVALVILVAALLWFIARSENSFKANSPGDTGTTTVNVGGVTVEVPSGSSATIEPVGEDLGPMPDLDRKVVFPTSFPQEAHASWQQKLSEIKAILVKNPRSYDAWLDMGIQWKMIEDYEGARLAWQYATKVSPTSAIAYGNLGFLYGYYLHDTVKAEAAYQTALKNAPDQLYLYEQMFEFYRDVLKDPAKARAIANQGAKATGNSAYFDQLLRTLK